MVGGKRGETRPSILVSGFGSIGRRHVRILRELGVEEIRVCDPKAEARDAASREPGVRQVYRFLEEGLAEAPEAVFICSPTDNHAEQAGESIGIGADVFVEKPLSYSLEEIDRLDKRITDSGRVVMVGHCFRYHQGLRKAVGWTREGRIGRLVSIRAAMGEYIPDVMPNYRNMYIFEEGGVYELMHDIDLVLWFAGQQAARVMALDGRFSDVGLHSPDLCEILIEFQNRCAASVHLDFFQRARRRQIELLGTDGTLIVEFGQWDRCRLSLFDVSSRKWHREDLVTDRDDMFRDEDGEFLAAVGSRGPSPLDIREARRAIEIVAAARESARTGVGIVLDRARACESGGNSQQTQVE